MGLREKYKKRDENAGFQPLELNEGNVQAIFNRCVATKDSTDIIGPILFTKKGGYSEDSKPIIFDKNIIYKNGKNIKYLYGQLKDAHLKNSVISPTSSTKDYKENNWTQDKGIILEFLHLGYTINLFNIFVKTDLGDLAKCSVFTPTLSPKDPNFPAWWEEHKAEWEDSAHAQPVDQ
jgi:hypothetical protein